MAIEQLLSSTRGLFFSLHETWCEASLVARTAAVAAPLVTLVGTVYLLRPRSLPKIEVKVEPKVPKEKEEEDEVVQQKPIQAVIVDGQMRIISVDLETLGIQEDDSSSDDEGMEWVDCAGPCMDFPDFIAEDPVQTSSLLPAMDDLFVRKEALGELEQQAGELISKLLGVVGGKTGNNPEPILEALARLSKAVEPLIAGMIEREISFDMSVFEGWVGKLTKLLESTSEKPDVQLNPQWAKRLDARLLKSLKQDSHSKLQYAWSGIIGAWSKTSVFNARVPAIRLAVSTFVPIEKKAKNYLSRMQIKQWAVNTYLVSRRVDLPEGWHESWGDTLQTWSARWEDKAVLERDKKLAELFTNNSEAVKEVFQSLFHFGLCLFDAFTNTLYDHSEHEVFNLFWDNRTALYEEAGEGKAELMAKLLNEAIAKAPLSSLQEALK